MGGWNRPTRRHERPSFTRCRANFGDPPVGNLASNIEITSHRIGEFAYAAYSQDPSWADFALIRLDPAIPVSPSMCYFGGPTGTYDDTAFPKWPGELNPIEMHLYGKGAAVGGTVPARTLVGAKPFSPTLAYAWGLTTDGDSGSPVTLADGRAVGWLVGETYPPPVVVNHSGHESITGPLYGNATIVRIGPAIARAEQVLGISLQLETAPLAHS